MVTSSVKVWVEWKQACEGVVRNQTILGTIVSSRLLFGGMTTTGRSESINAFVKRFIGSHTSLSLFVKQVDLAIETIEQT